MRMWRAYPEAVASYALAICDERSCLGKADTVADSVHATRHAAVVAKLPEHYANRYTGTEPGSAYYWPV